VLIELPLGRDGPRGQPAEPPARLSLHSHREPVSHDTPITSSCPNISRVLLQEPHRVGGSIVTRTDVRPEARWLGRTAKGSGKRREAPEAEVADFQLTDLPNGLQAIEDLKTCSVATHVDSTKAKTVMTIVTHVEADLEDTP
jgi:hypothetical protein